VLLTTQDNLGSAIATGSDFSIGGKVGKALSYRVSGSLFYNQLDAGNLGIGSSSVVSGTVKANVDYKINTRDLIQLTADYGGRRLIAQGYREPGGGANLGFRHQFKPALALVATLADIFDSQRNRYVLDTPILKEVSLRRRSIRTASLALSWSFGGSAKKANPKFDYSDQ
jgi:hypothetical protein